MPTALPSVPEHEPDGPARGRLANLHAAPLAEQLRDLAGARPEIFFYLLFAVALFLPKSPRLLALTAVFVGLVASGFLFPSERALHATYTRPMILEFLAGVFIGKASATAASPPPGSARH